MPGRMMHDGEVATDVRLVRRLLAGQFSQWAGLPVAPVPLAGTDNALYRLGDDMAVRLPRIAWAADDVAKEQEWLPRLGPHLPVPVPQPLGQGEPAEGYPWPWSVYRWLPGDNPVVGRIADPDRLAVEVARFVTALRRLDTTGAPPAARGVPLAQRDGPTRAAIDALHDTVDTSEVTRAWDAALDRPTCSGPARWLHADLSPGNLLCVAGRLSGVIDFGCLGSGDPAADLIVAWNLLPAESRGTFRDAVEVDDDTWARGRGWALSIALIQLPYYRATNPALAANARHVIGEVLADHEHAAARS